LASQTAPLNLTGHYWYGLRREEIPLADRLMASQSISDHIAPETKKKAT